MHTTDIYITLGSIIAALIALVPMYFTLRQGERRDLQFGYIERIKELEKQLEECRARNQKLQEENIDLMRRVLK